MRRYTVTGTITVSCSCCVEAASAREAIDAAAACEIGSLAVSYAASRDGAFGHAKPCGIWLVDELDTDEINMAGGEVLEDKRHA